MSRPERPADTRGFYMPALGIPLTTGAATSHPATCGPREGTAAVIALLLLLRMRLRLL